MDLAAHPGLRAAAPGARCGRRCALALAVTAVARTAYSGARAPRLFALARAPGQPSAHAKTLRTLARAASRQAFPTRQTRPGGQIDPLNLPALQQFDLLLAITRVAG